MMEDYVVEACKSNDAILLKGLSAAGAVNSRINPPSYQQNPFQPSSAGGPTAPGKKPDEEAPLISFD